MSTRMRADAQVFSITNPSLTTTGASQASTIPDKCNYILISNIDTAINALVSFNDVTYLTIKPGASLSIDCDNFKARNLLYLKSASGTPTIEVMYGAEV